MTEIDVPTEQTMNGTAPAAEGQGMQLPEGTIQVPPSIVAVLSRLLQQDQRVQDVLYAYLQGKGETGPLSLVLPVVLLVRPKEQ